jgi:hypothetical protein
MAVSWRRGPAKTATAFALALLAILGLALLTSQPAAAGIVAKDGKIHACYKAKGKGKGALRVVRSAKVKCPKKWKKVAWSAGGVPGPRGETGPTGATGEKGEKGTAGVVVVEELETQVDELLEKVKSLEAILKGVTNTELKEAIATLANIAALETAVDSLCAQAGTLTDQLNAVEEALGGLSLNTLLAVVLEIPPLPGALPSYSCPTF